MFKNRKKPLPEILDNFANHVACTFGFNFDYYIEDDTLIKGITLWSLPDLEPQDDIIVNVDVHYRYLRPAIVDLKEDILRLLRSLKKLFKVLNYESNANLHLSKIACTLDSIVLNFGDDVYVQIPYNYRGYSDGNTNEPIEFRGMIVHPDYDRKTSFVIPQTTPGFDVKVDLIRDYCNSPTLAVYLSYEWLNLHYNSTKLDINTCTTITSTVHAIQKALKEYN